MSNSTTQAQQFVADNPVGSDNSLAITANYSGAFRVTNVRHVFPDGSAVVIRNGRSSVYAGKTAKSKK